MNEQERKELYELFQAVGRTEAINQFASKHDFTLQYVMGEIDHMINGVYSMACN